MGRDMIPQNRNCNERGDILSERRNQQIKAVIGVFVLGNSWKVVLRFVGKNLNLLRGLLVVLVEGNDESVVFLTILWIISDEAIIFQVFESLYFTKKC